MGIEINDLKLLQYAAKQINEDGFVEIGDTFPADKCVCFGEYNREGNPLWVVVLYHFKEGHDCMIGLAMNLKGMFTPRLIRMMGRVIFQYAFEQAKLKRCTVTIRESNKSSLKLAQKWGFKIEGIKRLGYNKPLEDLYILGLLKSECKFIGE